MRRRPARVAPVAVHEVRDRGRSTRINRPTLTASAACAAARRATGTRYGERADVVEPDLVEEVNRRRIAAVLAADAELEVRAASARPCSHADPHELRRRRRRRSSRTDPCRGSSCPDRRAGTCRRRRARSRTSSASGRWCRTRRTRASVGDLVGGQRAARHFDHRADQVLDLDALLLHHLGGDAIDDRPSDRAAPSRGRPAGS